MLTTLDLTARIDTDTNKPSFEITGLSKRVDVIPSSNQSVLERVGYIGFITGKTACCYSVQ